MSTTVLLIILVVCALAVMAAVGYAAWRGFKLARTASRTAGKYSAASMRLSQEAARAQERLAEIGARQGQIFATLDDLRVSLMRLQVVVKALDDAVRPLRTVARYFGL
jgi:hypothetical protein